MQRKISNDKIFKTNHFIKNFSIEIQFERPKSAKISSAGDQYISIRILCNAHRRSKGCLPITIKPTDEWSYRLRLHSVYLGAAYGESKKMCSSKFYKKKRNTNRKKSGLITKRLKSSILLWVFLFGEMGVDRELESLDFI